MSVAPEIVCQELVEVITDYLEGALPEVERLRFEEHLGRCSPCAVYVEQFRAVIGAMGRIESESLDPSLRADLLAAFSGWARGTS